MLKDLVILANRLDQRGLRKEADRLDFIIRKLAQAEDFQLTHINNIDVENEYIYSDEIFSQIPNSENLRLRFKDSLGNEFDALVKFDKIGSTNMDDMNSLIQFSTESSDAAMDYAKQQALGIYSHKNDILTKQFDRPNKNLTFKSDVGIEVGEIIDEAGRSEPTKDAYERMHRRFLELSRQHGVHEVREALAAAIEYGPLGTVWDNREVGLAEFALSALAN